MGWGGALKLGRKVVRNTIKYREGAVMYIIGDWRWVKLKGNVNKCFGALVKTFKW